MAVAKKIKNSADPRLEMFYTSRNGTKFYRFKNPMEFPAMRGIAAERAKRFAGMNLCEKEMRQLLEECSAAAGKQDLVRAFAIIHEVKYRLDFICEENSLLDLAFLYILLEDEDPDNPTEEHNARKTALVKSDFQLRAFFLQMAVSITNLSGQRREEALLAYMEESKGMAERILKFLPPTPTPSS